LSSIFLFSEAIFLRTFIPHRFFVKDKEEGSRQKRTVIEHPLLKGKIISQKRKQWFNKQWLTLSNRLKLRSADQEHPEKERGVMYSDS
jgi:hypothetical protein